MDRKTTAGSATTLLAAVLLVSACGGISVSSDWDPSANFSAFQTFSWVPDAETAGSGQAADQLTDRRIRATIEANLTGKGFRKVDTGGDFGVGYQVSTSDQVSYSTMSSGWSGGGYRWGGGWGMGTGMSTTTQTTTTTGTLLIAVFDQQSKNLVWQGSGEKTLSGSAQSPEERSSKIEEAVTKIMEDFPPGS